MKNALLYFLVATGITASAFYATRTLTTNNDDVYDLSQSTMSDFCETEILDRNNDPNSAIFVTIENVDETSMIIEIESATDDPVDRLVVNNAGTEPPFGCDPCVVEGATGDGKLSVTIFWGAPPADVSINLLWSKTSFEGNVESETITVPFAATCEDDGGGNGGGVARTNVVDFPIDFECEFTEYNFTEFGGAPTIVVDNPVSGAGNMSAKVARMEKVGGEFAGAFIDLEDPIDFGISSVIKLKTYSPKAGITVRLKIEDSNDGGSFEELDATITNANTWEELSFDFSGTNAATRSLDRVVLFFDFAVVGDGSIYYFDDLVQESNDDVITCEDPDAGGGNMVTNVVDFPIDFECEFTEYNFIEFGGAPTIVVDNPVSGDGNTSAKVAQMEKVGGEFAGAFIDLEDPIDFGISSVIKLKAYSPKAGITVRLKIEDSTNGGSFEELDATITNANTWEELSFDFSATAAASKSLNRVVLFFDFAVVGDGSIYYFDDIIQEGNNDVIACEDPDGSGNVAGTNIVDFPIDFECEFTAYAFQEFGGAPTIVIDNPDASGLNTSSKVAQMTKVQDAADFAGTILTLEDEIDFSKGMVFKIKTWSPKVGAVVKLKLENLTDGAIANEEDATTTVANTWEELTFDFSDTDANTKSLQKVVIFFDFGNFGDNSIYYFDDLIQEGNDDVIACEDPGSGGGVEPNSIVFPVDFECEFIENYIAVDFEGTFTQVIDNPFAEGINTSPRVAQTVKGNGAATFAGTIINLAEPIDFNISKLFTLKVRSPRANVLVKLKLEQTGNGAIANEKDAFTTVADQWEELTFDFSDTDASNAKMLQSIVVFFDFGNVGDGASYFFDDVVQVGNTGMTDCQAPTEPSEDAFRPPVCETAIAVYSDTYEQRVTNLNINAFSGSTVLTEVQIDGNNIFRYDNFDFQGIQFDPLDASASTNLHVDIWSQDLDKINIFPISPGPAEKPFELNLTRGEWNRFDIPLSEFSDVVDLSNIFQFKFDGGTGTQTVFIDNLYVNGECYIAPECAELVWADEFNGNSLNLDDWTYEIGDGCPELCGWGNQELQFYREENTTVADGILTITAKEESFGGYEYTSSRIITQGKQDFTYGRMEASIKVPEGQGIWPAFWMFHSNGEYGVWPLSGEIDIMEYLGQETDRIFGTIHHGDLFPNNRNTSGDFRLVQGGFNDDFYEYAIEWEENIIRWYVNDYLYLTLTPEDIAPDPWAFNQDFHFLLNVAVGGTLPGNPDDSTVFPQAMEVDYVRVYKGRFPHLTGAQRVDFMTVGEVYTVNNGGPGSTYNWNVTGGIIIDGQGTSQITVDWAGASKDAMVTVDVTNDCGVESTINLNVEVDVERVAEKEFSFENFDDEAMVEFLFSNGAFEDNVANPAPDDLNDSDLVGRYTRDANTQFDVIVYGTEAIPDASEFTSGSKSFFIDIYTDAPVGTPILLQLENSTEAEPANFPTGRHSRYTAKTTVQNAWQRLAFEFMDRPDGSTSDLGIDRIILLFNSNTFTGDTFFYDNLDKYCTDERDKCFDDMDISMTDPCNCDNPNNITLDSGRFLFEDTLKVDASSFTDPVVTLASQNGNLFDANGRRYTTETAQFVDLGGGIFGLQYFTRYVSPATIVIDVNGQQQEFTTASCIPCSGVVAENVPTMSEWGLLIFGLFMVNVGLVFMYRMRNSLVME